MKKSVVVLLSIMLACILFFCACEEEPEPSGDVLEFSSEIYVLLSDGKKEISNRYESDFFRNDSRVFDKNLALLSYALAASTSPENAVKTLGSMWFDNLEQHWNGDDDINGCSYVIGSRKVGDSNLVAIYIKGIDYNVEWAGNLTIGALGNHAGFETAAAEVYAALKEYLAANNLNDNLKIWITGYSRGGAITDVLAYDIITKKEVAIQQENLFVYAFEPPASLSSNAIAEEYQCIHNFYAESDLIPSIPPAITSADYGLSRPGTDLKTDSSVDRVNGFLHQYVDPDVSMPAFTAGAFVSGDSYTNPAEFLACFIKGVTSATEDATAASLENRDKYYSTIQNRLPYLVKTLMKNNRAGVNALIEYITIHKDELMTIFFRWVVGDGFYEDLAPILDSCGTEYVASDLKAACSVLPSLYLNIKLDAFLLNIAGDDSMISNVKYIISCHYPEVCYALLKGYSEN